MVHGEPVSVSFLCYSNDVGGTDRRLAVGLWEIGGYLRGVKVRLMDSHHSYAPVKVFTDILVVGIKQEAAHLKR